MTVEEASGISFSRCFYVGEPDAPSASASEPVLVLSAPTVLPIAPSKERTARGATETTSVVLPLEEVRAKAEELE